MAFRNSQPIYIANQNTQYIGLQPGPTNYATNNQVHTPLKYDPVTGTLSVNAIKFNEAGITTSTGLPSAARTFINVPYLQTIVANRYTIIEPFYVTIKPSSVSSRILIFASWFGEVGAAAPWNVMFSIARDGAIIGKPAGDLTSRNPGHAPPINSHYAASFDADSTPEAVEIAYLDSPNTTNACTYSLLIWSDAAMSLATNRDIGGADSTGYERGSSIIFAIETQ